MDILIHATRRRLKYLEFMTKRIPKSKILVDFGRGNIGAYMYSFKRIPNTGNTWHFEDDVLPDRRIKDWMEAMDSVTDGIVCGFGTTKKYGIIEDPEDMWYSFPCIRIPNDYLKDFEQWIKFSGDPDVARRMELGKGIDFLFHKFVVQNPIPIYHHNPCMVEHIDDLIGGSLINKRDKTIKAINFTDKEGLEELKQWLEGIK